MNKFIAAAVAMPAALAALSGCASYDDYGYGSVGVGYNSYSGYPGYYRPYGAGYGGYYGNPYGYYDAYYDNFYGPIYGGFWHNDGFFYYQSYSGGPWYCDYNNHFRRDRFHGGVPGRYPDWRNDDERGNWNQSASNVRDYLNGNSSSLNGNPGQGSQGQVNGQVSGQVNAQPNGQPAPPPRQRATDRARELVRGPRSSGSGGDGGGSSSPQSAPQPPSPPPSSGGRGGGGGGAFDRARDMIRGNR